MKMKSKICSIALVLTLSAGVSLFAQVRGGGRPAGVGNRQGAQDRPTVTGQDRSERQNRGTEANREERRDERRDERREDRNNRIANEINDNPQLRSRLQEILPGTNIDTASSGFKNKGQFIAAVHVSNNLGIPFDQLKDKMVSGDMSLGKAVQELRPDLSKDEANREAKKAEAQSKRDTDKKS
jgi:hypothetical protein